MINIKVNPVIKKKAQGLAEELGLSLSTVINRLLKYFIQTKTLVFSAKEEPTEYLLEALKESKKDIKAGYASPSFSNAKDAINWLNDPKARYKNGRKVQ